MKQYVINRIAKGLCPDCGKIPPAQGKRICDECSERRRVDVAKRRQHHKDTGVCLTASCGKPTKKGCWCEDCLESRRVAAVEYRRSNRDNGLCMTCSASPVCSNGMCERCELRQMAKRHLGNRDAWQPLKDKLVKQGYRCAYTGMPIVLGATASIDHLVPRSGGGKDDISNLQWVHLRINMMKGEMPHDEFVAFLEEVGKHLMSKKTAEVLEGTSAVLGQRRRNTKCA